MSRYRFAFDLGSGSLGWAVFKVEKKNYDRKDRWETVEMENLGVRIFPTGRDPKSHKSNAAGRREPRGMRRQLDRRIRRRKRLDQTLVDHGLMPPASDKDARDSFFAINPYQARGKCASDKAELNELGRAIWHISKHRGFKSNRKADGKNEDETGKIATASKRLEEKLKDANALTYGAWLAERHEKKEPVRVRPGSLDPEELAAELDPEEPADAENEADKKKKKINDLYDFYPQRDMLECEFDRMWEEQAEHHDLTDTARDAIRDVVFYQRPLKPVEPGRCTFFPEEERLPKWHPLAQEYLILQDLNNLRMSDGCKDWLRMSDGCKDWPLDRPKRDLIAKQLMSGKKMTWKELRNTIKPSGKIEFNLENDKELSYNAVACRMITDRKKNKVKHLAPLPDWLKWSDEDQLDLLKILDEEQEPEDVRRRLREECGLDDQTASAVEKISLPDGHLRFCKKAVQALVTVMREKVVVYSKAVEIAEKRELLPRGTHHSDFRADGPGLDKLPRYNELDVLQRMIGTGSGNLNDPHDKRYGRINNPTVHVALGQFRRVMNALIQRYGKPEEVVIETARDMKHSTKEIKKINKENKENKEQNDKWRSELEEKGHIQQGAPVGDRFLRMRLWEELGENVAERCCPYSGKQICLTKLHSDEVEIDHILPFKRTYDDSRNNKTVCFRSANRYKSNKAPGEFWSGDQLDKIIARVKASKMSEAKKWRFRPDAMKKWEEDKSFEDRQLNATKYMAKVIRAYAEALFPNDGSSHVWVVPGQMTAMLRDAWGVNPVVRKKVIDLTAKEIDQVKDGSIRCELKQATEDQRQAIKESGADKKRLEKAVQELKEALEAWSKNTGREYVCIKAKNRDDHRHHAIDAAVVGVTDRSLVQKLNTLTRKYGYKDVEKSVENSDQSDQEIITRRTLKKHLDEPYPGYGRQVREKFEKIHVSHKPNHRTSGELHEETAYGPVRDDSNDHEIGNLVVRKKVVHLTATQIGQIRDESIRYDLLQETEGRRDNEKLLKKALQEWSKNTGHKQLRILVKKATARPIYRRDGKPDAGKAYKYMIPGENLFVDILEGTDGNWFHYVTDLWGAADGTAVPWREKHPDARFIMRLFKDDTVQLYDLDKHDQPVEGSNQIKRVVSIQPSSNRVRLAGEREAGDLQKRHEDTGDPFRSDLATISKLKARRARRVRVDESGRVRVVPQ